MDLASNSANPPILMLMLSADETVYNARSLRKFAEEVHYSAGPNHGAYAVRHVVVLVAVMLVAVVLAVVLVAVALSTILLLLLLLPRGVGGDGCGMEIRFSPVVSS